MKFDVHNIRGHGVVGGVVVVGGTSKSDVEKMSHNYMLQTL